MSDTVSSTCYLRNGISIHLMSQLQTSVLKSDPITQIQVQSNWILTTIYIKDNKYYFQFWYDLHGGSCAKLYQLTAFSLQFWPLCFPLFGELAKVSL